jgi:hypothetical protein
VRKAVVKLQRIAALASTSALTIQYRCAQTSSRRIVRATAMAFWPPVGIDIFLITSFDDVCLTVTTSPSRL